MRIAIAAGLGLAATAASASIVLPPAAPRRASAPVVAAPRERPAPEEEPLEVEILRPTPIDADEPAPLPTARSLGLAPPEARDARLTVRLTDERTGAPVAMEVRLWRLGVPEDDRWTEGDLDIGTIKVSEDGGSTRDLVPGCYRLFCDAQRAGATDPPGFEVRSGENELRIAVDSPHTVPVWLRVVDEDGRPIEEGTARFERLVGKTRRSEGPEWAVRRWEKREDGTLGVYGGVVTSHCVGVACRRGRPAGIAVRAAPEGFALGTWTEDSRETRSSRDARFEFEGRSAVAVSARLRDGNSGTFLAPSLSPARLLEGVSLEEGGSPLDRGALVESQAHAIPIREGDPADAWRSIPIRVKVTLSGYRTLEFEHTIEEGGSGKLRVMEIARADSE